MNISTTYCNSTSLRFHFSVYLFIIGLLSILSLTLHAQEKPRSYIIAGISVEGNTYADAQTIISISGLRIGEEIKIVNVSTYNIEDMIKLFIKELKYHIKDFENNNQMLIFDVLVHENHHQL